MVIQRWQSLLLLAAAVLMGLSMFVDFAGIAGEAGTVMTLSAIDGFIGLTIAASMTALLYVVDIFLYSTFKTQKSVLKIGYFFNVVTLGLLAYHIFTAATPGQSIVWKAGCIFPVLGLILAIMAMSRIRHDERLLKSADRLR